MRAIALVVLLIPGCANGPPRYASSTPRVLPDAAAPVEPAEVLLSFAPFRWYGALGSPSDFRVALSTLGGDAPRTAGERLGDVRTPDRVLPDADDLAVFCGWTPSPDHGCTDEQGQRARAHIDAILADLRAEAARIGAGEVRDARCYVRASRLWCEGTATSASLDLARAPAVRPSGAVVPSAVSAPSRWRLGASASFGRYGDRIVTGTTLSLAYRGAEIAFHMVSPTSHDAAGIGADAVYRHRARDKVSVLGGVTTMLMTPLSPGGEAEPARAVGTLGPVIGVAYHPDVIWFDGFGRPFAELRLGWLGARRDHQLDGLNLELLVGLTTP